MTRAIGVIVVVSITLLSCVLRAQDAPVVEREPFVPHAGYKHMKATARIAANPDLAAAAPMVVEKRGVRRVPVILLKFKDTKDVFPKEDYQSLLFSPIPTAVDPPRMTFSQYYRDMSGGEWEIDGDVVGWFELPHPAKYYENNFDANADGKPELYRNGTGKEFGELLEFGLKQADAVLDFGLYDNDGLDGEANSGDDDGQVDTVIFIHAKRAAECAKPYTAVNIRSHSSQYHAKQNGHKSPFKTADFRRGKKGEDLPVIDPETGEYQTIVVTDYTIQPALACDEEFKIVGIGVFCHEYGHALGLPDLYDRSPSPKPDSFGVGNYCVMAGGAYGAAGKNPKQPVAMSAWARTHLGWATLEPILAGTFNFEAAQTRRKVYWYDVPGTDGKEYFLMEYRKRDWFDPTRLSLNWDSELLSSGLAIWHVDERVGRAQKEQPWPLAPINKGQNDAASMPAENAVGFRQEHALVALIQADRALHLEKANNPGDANDLWGTGGDFDDDAACVAGTRGYDGKASGLRLHGIDLVNQRVEAVAPEPVVSDDDAIESALLSNVMAVSAPMLMALERVVPESLDFTTSDATAALARLSSAGEVEEVTGDDGDLQRVPEKAGDRKRAEARFLAALSELLAASSTTPRQIRTVDSTRLRRVASLTIPVGLRSVEADARDRVDSESFKLLVEGADLREVEGVVGAARHFEQLLTVGDEQLPVFEKGVVLYYKDRSLRTIDADLVDPKTVSVAGDHNALESQEVLTIASKYLGADAASITSIREGILFDESAGREMKGNVVYEVRLRVGTAQEDVRLYIDESTRLVRAIR